MGDSGCRAVEIHNSMFDGGNDMIEEFVGGIDADTSKCDNTLLHLYNVSAMDDINITYEDFENFMVELIV